MSQQAQITTFFRNNKGGNSPMESQHRKRKLTLNRIKCEDDIVVILSSDDDDEKVGSSPATLNLSQNSDGTMSDSSNATVIYSLEAVTPDICKVECLDTPVQSPNTSSASPLNSPTPNKYRMRSPSTPVRHIPIVTSMSVASPLGSPTPEKWKVKSPITPMIHAPQTPTKSLVSPSGSSKKYYSPNKKRSVTKKTPKRTQRNLISDFLTRKSLFNSNEDEAYLKACEGVDDKTKFLLKIVNDYLKDDSLHPFLDEQSVTLLSNLFTVPKLGMRLVCRLYWRKEGWYRKEQVVDICTENKQEVLDEGASAEMLEALVANKFLDAGTNQNIRFEEFTSILKADELKEICKDLKLKTQSKKSAVESLQDFCRRTSISSYFTSNNAPSNSKRLLQIMSTKAGTCYKLSDLARSTLDKLYTLTYLGIDYDIIREKRLELMLINEKVGRETFPICKSMRIDNATVVFDCKDDFERYLFARNIYEEFMSATDTSVRCQLTKQAFDLYNSIDADSLLKCKFLPIWLQRFTPPYIYVKIMEAGVQELKKGKENSNCVLASEILSLLTEQTFRQYKKAELIAEWALVLHSYLNDPDQAAHVLLKGFELSLSEECKDAMRPRAKKLAQQKNITLSDDTRQVLLAYANKESILESNIPSQHFYKQPMDNITKGKAMYETKSESGRVMQGVEEYALSTYLLQGDYTAGGHWEGRIITTIFFLLFWNIIYSKPKKAAGIFLSHYQKYPLDMFTEEFYFNRREAIEQRLRFIEECGEDELVRAMMTVLDERPESELSGIHRDISRRELASVARCVGARGVAAICRRLAADYRYSHSGFPDLTIWNDDTKKVKFVEVKSDNDKPSMKQIQWMQYLTQHAVDVEFCYVGANTERVRARRPRHRESQAK